VKNLFDLKRMLKWKIMGTKTYSLLRREKKEIRRG